MEYNTKRNHLLMPEYGRNIQRMVEYIKTIQDPEKRQRNAESIIELMGILNPHLKNVEDFRHKLWDHIFTISNFEIEINSPYPIPTKESLNQRPKRLPYPKKSNKHKHIGQNIYQIIEKAIAETDPGKKRGYINTIVYYMKLAYQNWHNEPMHDDHIREELNVLSKGQLEYQPGDVFVRYNRNNHSHSNNNNNNNTRRFSNSNSNNYSNQNSNNRKPSNNGGGYSNNNNSGTGGQQNNRMNNNNRSNNHQNSNHSNNTNNNSNNQGYKKNNNTRNNNNAPKRNYSSKPNM